MVQWLTDRVIKYGKGIEDVVKYMMLVNFGAIHTSSNVGVHPSSYLALDRQRVLELYACAPPPCSQSRIPEAP